MDGGADAGPGTTGSGCACRTSGRAGSGGTALLALGAAAFVVARRRRRAT
jgi:MYXO-CTERM domain-containing protein